MSDITNLSKIYIFNHKPKFISELDSIYQPLVVGNYLLNNQNLFLGDNTGDNISSKNEYYCELTGIYWLWKNTTQDIVGSCHYRRYFTYKSEPFWYKIKRLLYPIVGLARLRKGLIVTSNTTLFSKHLITQSEINEILSNYDLIVPKPSWFKRSVKKQYQRHHNEGDLIILESIIEKLYPAYINSFNKVLEQKWFYAFNMFIMKNEHFQDYMKWLFDILFEFEKQVDLKSYKGYQKRVIGFLAERLFNVWVTYQNLTCKELDIIYFEKLKN